jgi:N6-adenosine-specific RNA methylase IME4
MTWPFDPLLPLSYDVIVADPPWPFDLYSSKGGRKSATAHYSTMTLDDIAALPVGTLAQRDAILLLWVTAPRLPDCQQVMRSWGFTYKTELVWRKTTRNAKVRMGPGYWARTMHESVLLGTIGRPSKFSAFPSLFDGLAREHSRKPDEFYRLVLKHTSGLRRADLFSRETRAGFDGWGDEHRKFDQIEEADDELSRTEA